MLDKAIALIEQQQGAREKDPHLWMMGEQLKDICRADSHAAELVAQDLQIPEMGLKKLEKKFDDYARGKNGQPGAGCLEKLRIRDQQAAEKFRGAIKQVFQIIISKL